MAEEAQPQSGSLKELKYSIIKQLTSGVEQGSVIQQLIERGWPEVSARHFVAGLVPRVLVNQAIAAHPAQMVNHGKWRALRGLAFMSAGLVIIIIGLALRDPSISLFTFSTGVIMGVFGLLDLLFGISDWGKSSDD
ncbi:MAG TPA: hypothetical protein VGK87_13605 [Anaerolineae bacterium]|jgi:hypothetical protein